MTNLDEVSGDTGGTTQSSMYVEQFPQDSDVLEIRFHLFHRRRRLQHRLETPDPRLLGLLQRQRRTKSVGNFHRLRVHAYGIVSRVLWGVRGMHSKEM